MVTWDKKMLEFGSEHPLNIVRKNIIGIFEKIGTSNVNNYVVIVAKYIYSKGTQNGKRVQAQGGAKNPVVLMPHSITQFQLFQNYLHH